MSTNIAYIMLKPGEKKPESCYTKNMECGYTLENNDPTSDSAFDCIARFGTENRKACPPTGRRDDCPLREVCPECEGERGQVLWRGTIDQEYQPCPTCHGKGMIGPNDKREG